jgi:predicted neuraminidase
MRILVALCFLSLTLRALAADGITITKVIGNEFPGKYKHPASITELDNGDLYVAYYGGGGEYEDDSKVWGLRRPFGKTAWTTPEVIADTPFQAEGNPVVWQAPDGVVWLFYVQRYGDTWSESRIKGKVSRDGARTWSDSFMVAFDQGMMVRSRPILLNGGDYLLGVYHETGKDREKVGADTSSLFLRFNPNTHTWTQSNKIYSRSGNLQPSPVQINDDYLVNYSRRGGGYGPVDDGYLVRSESRDGGRNWSPGEDSEFPNPNAAADFIKLRNGHLMLVYNHNMSDRTPLTVAISEDNDKSYPHRRHIGEGNHSFAYPVVIQTRDGRLHVLYTTNQRSTVMLASFDEAAILGHTLPE